MREKISWQRFTRLSPSQKLSVLAHLDSLQIEMAREPIDENRRRAIVHDLDAIHYVGSESGTFEGYAMMTVDSTPSLEMAGGGFSKSLREAVHEAYQEFYWWIRDSSSGAPANSELVRSLDLLISVEDCEKQPLPESISVRTFDPLNDNVTWLEHNNAAFATHPEQGAWTLNDLRTRIEEPWFDPSGFLLICEDDEIVASCWTKIHELSPERFGEIYVIAVSPNHQGRGLGAVALSHGICSLRSRGVKTIKLFVDESNIGAQRLYQRFGFTLERRDNVVRFRRP